MISPTTHLLKLFFLHIVALTKGCVCAFIELVTHYYVKGHTHQNLLKVYKFTLQNVNLRTIYL